MAALLLLWHDSHFLVGPGLPSPNTVADDFREIRGIEMDRCPPLVV